MLDAQKAATAARAVEYPLGLNREQFRVEFEEYSHTLRAIMERFRRLHLFTSTHFIPARSRTSHQ